MRVAPIAHMSLSDKTYESLKQMIIRWELWPGERLLDSELAQRFGVSRSLVRNALTMLASDGLVRVSRRGFYVIEFTQKDVCDLLEFRRLLEMSSLRAAVENTSESEIVEMESRLAEAQSKLESGELEKFYHLDVETHGAIIDKGDNSYTKKVYANLSTILSMIIRSDFSKQPKISEAFKEHQAIFDAWKRRDVEGALAALDHHLARAEARVRENFVQNLSEARAAAGQEPESRRSPISASTFKLISASA